MGEMAGNPVQWREITASLFSYHHHSSLTFTMAFETPPLPTLQATLSDPTTPIAMRMRATYYLRQLYDNADNNGDDEALHIIIIDALCQQLLVPSHGCLLRHEIAYVLGQLRDVRALPALESILSSKEEDVMVRHECAEALGAIGSPSSIPLLLKCSKDSSVEVGQTCQLAHDFLLWKQSGGDTNSKGEEAPPACACMLSPYNSHDPAPPHPDHLHLSPLQIGDILNDDQAPLFARFRAMFSLRNRGDVQSIHALGTTLVNDTSSALLRHEVAYVMGQLGHPSCVEYLVESLKRKGEHKMVRHESAEALGAIEERWGECEVVLKMFLEDEDVVVRESCLVALDAADYFGYLNVNDNDEKEEKDGGEKGVNFSMHKARSDGRVDGVLKNHFNIVA